MTGTADDYSAIVVTLGSDDDLYLRIVPNGEGLSPKWYWHDGKDFTYIEDSTVHDVVYKEKLLKDSQESEQ